MRRTKKNLPYHELIGLEVRVLRHSDPTLEGLIGRVIDERKNMLKIVTGVGVIKKVPKFWGEFLFKLQNNRSVRVDGLHLLGRPEERVKKVR